MHKENIFKKETQERLIYNNGKSMLKSFGLNKSLSGL